MARELIKDKLTLTPHRMFGIVKLIGNLGRPQRTVIQKLAQPATISDDKETVRLLVRYLQRYGLVEAEGEKATYLHLTVAGMEALEWEKFRHTMQRRLLGATEESEDDFLLGQFAAWYCTQDERVLTYSKSNMEAAFHEAMYPNVTERVLAEEPGISAWRTWAEFLGWGWPLKFGGSEMRIVPDARVRIAPFLDELLPADGSEIAMRNFVQGLGKRCPELDTGVLHEQCWQAGRGNEQRGNRLSLMLSTALRTLFAQGRIELMDRADARDRWHLFPSQSHINAASSIRRKVLS